MNEKLLSYLTKPELYANSTAKFWDDEHISKGMLEAHLNSEFEGASRRHQFVDQSVDWITHIAPSAQYIKLLDLGCGPGLYTERFYNAGYQVTGIDYSTRSLEYANHIAEKNGYSISYQYQNYLDIEYVEEFDVITLIYCDFCVLSDVNRKKLLEKIYRTLKPNGKFIVDVNTTNLYEGREDTREWYYSDCDFWSDKPHLCLDAFVRYDDSNTMLHQAIIVTESLINCYYIWDHTFTKNELESDLNQAGFLKIDFYGDIAGAEYKTEGSTMCAVAVK